MNAQTQGTKGSGDSAAARKAAAEKKKLLALLAFVAIGLLLWGRVLIQRVPRTVVADPDAAQAATADPSPAPAAVATVADGNEERTAINIDLPQKLPRDLFALDATRYTRIISDSDIRPQGKSEPQASDVSQRPTSGNSGLTLQATILGEHPCAVINGQVVRPGQKIKGFVLRKVLPQRVVLEMNGVEITLTK